MTQPTPHTTHIHDVDVGMPDPTATTTQTALGTATHIPPPTTTDTQPHHILGVQDIANHPAAFLETAHKLKALGKNGAMPQVLANKSVVLIFEKPSTRTRISFQIGIQKLGGVVTTMDAQTSQLGRGETLEDTALVLSRYADALVYRANSHTNVEEVAKHATVPVINALTDLEHPCQILADLQTLDHHWGGTQGDGLIGKTLAYIGDGNNMCQSYMLAAPLYGLDLHIATPPGYEPDKDVYAEAKALAEQCGTELLVTHDPTLAASGADAIATDTWTSMGDEAEQAERLEAFDGYQVDDALMAEAKDDAVFLHCLPGHWGEEATHDVAHGPNSLILDQAENRMWAQMALLWHLIGQP